MSRKIETDLNNILSLVNCAQDYGFYDDVLMCAFAEMTGWVADKEIAAYVAESFLTEVAKSQGYGPEDADAATARIQAWRQNYMKETLGKVAP